MRREDEELENKLIKYGIIGHVMLGLLIGFNYAGVGGALLGGVLGVVAGFMFGITIIPAIGILLAGGFLLAIIGAIAGFFIIIGYLWNVGKQ